MFGFKVLVVELKPLNMLSPGFVAGVAAGCDPNRPVEAGAGVVPFGCDGVGVAPNNSVVDDFSPFVRDWPKLNVGALGFGVASC